MSIKEPKSVNHRPVVDGKESNMTSKKIAVANIKGGCGKTTIATNFACISAGKQKKTVLIDADHQESSMKFRALRPDDVPQFQAVSIQTNTIHKDISGFQADNIFIDTGGRDTKVFRSAIMAADVILIPLLPGQYDLWSSEDTFKIIEEIKTFKDDIKVGAILNQVISGTIISKDVMGVMNDFIETYGLKLFDTKLFARVAYKESVSEGLAVTEMDGAKYKVAKEETNNLYNEVMSWV